MKTTDDINENLWEDPTDLQEVVDFIRSLTSDPKYSFWTTDKVSSTCKYLSLRFDMRDGAFVILNREGKRITFDQLKGQ